GSQLTLQLSEALVAGRQFLVEPVELAFEIPLGFFKAAPLRCCLLREGAPFPNDLVQALGRYSQELLGFVRVIAQKPALQRRLADAVGCGFSRHEVKDGPR
ncbi:MAG: hypothetical protein ACXVRI_02810, partial [Gaiellaceae bacterium]